MERINEWTNLPTPNQSVVLLDMKFEAGVQNGWEVLMIDMDVGVLALSGSVLCFGAHGAVMGRILEFVSNG